MATIQRVITDVPQANLAFQKSLFEVQDFTVEVRSQADGLFTLIASKDDTNDAATPPASPPLTTPAQIPDVLTTALRTAVRLNEIGNKSPYQLSFAGKGKSGASFGFMQGDLAAGQSVVQAAFRAALAAAGHDDRVPSLLAALSVPLIQNPLSAEDTVLVNSALAAPAGQKQVDDMDTAIFDDVRKNLDRCVAVAQTAGRTIAANAQIYMFLWINMTGPPTTLLTWLSGQPVTMAAPAAAPGAVIDARAMENYLRASSFFTENSDNLNHLLQSAAAGARALDVAPATGSARLTARPGINLTATPATQQLVSVVGEASKSLPDGCIVCVTSTIRPGATVAGTGGQSQHALGNAIDIQIIDQRGAAIPNEGTDRTGLYQMLAIAAFHANERLFPARAGQLAWGGNFTTGPADGPRDLMHFDYHGDRGRFGLLAREATQTGECSS